MPAFRRLHWIVGTLFGLTFVLLLSLRLGLLEKDKAGQTAVRLSDVRTLTDREVWMNIFQQDQKIGYVHRQTLETFEGYRILESVFMQVNAMGMVQDIRFKTEGNLHHDLTLASFDVELLSSLFRFKARGILKDKILTVLLTSGSGPEQKIELPVKGEVHLSTGILEALNVEDLKPGRSRVFYVFDPIATVERPLRVTVLGEETILIMGNEKSAKKVSVDFMGAPQFAWIGKDGTVLKEEGSLGIRLEQATREEALRKVKLLPGRDLAEVASVPVSKAIHDVEKLSELKLSLEGIEKEALFLHGGRQSLKDRVLTIRKESLEGLPAPSVKPPSERMETFLEPASFIQSDHPEIRAKAREIVSPNDRDTVKAVKLVRWVNENISKRPVLSVPSALEVLRNRVGDCNEHAVLLAALARASGIPAQVEAGLVYQKGRFYYHAWNVLYLGTWVTVDSVTGQFPADVTHVRLVRGTESQIDLVRIIGKVKIEILGCSK